MIFLFYIIKVDMITVDIMITNYKGYAKLSLAIALSAILLGVDNLL